MAKLSGLRSRVTPLRGRLGRIEAERGAAVRAVDERHWRRWYKTGRWQRLRWSVLVRDRFTCAMCGRGPQGDTSALVADHRRPHRGDAALFWDESNLRTLCAAPCHASLKQREEARAG